MLDCPRRVNIDLLLVFKNMHVVRNSSRRSKAKVHIGGAPAVSETVCPRPCPCSHVTEGRGRVFLASVLSQAKGGKGGHCRADWARLCEG